MADSKVESSGELSAKVRTIEGECFMKLYEKNNSSLRL